MCDLIERDALEAKIRENSMQIQFFNPSVSVILHLIRYAPAVNRWIPCSERLPEKDTPVLICAAGHRVTAYYDAVKDAFRLTESDDLFYLKSAVTHWMPLPEPPEKE